MERHQGRATRSFNISMVSPNFCGLAIVGHIPRTGMMRIRQHCQNKIRPHLAAAGHLTIIWHAAFYQLPCTVGPTASWLAYFDHHSHVYDRPRTVGIWRATNLTSKCACARSSALHTNTSPIRLEIYIYHRDSISPLYMVRVRPYAGYATASCMA